MEVRGNAGKGPLLFEWNPSKKMVSLIRKDMYYEILLEEDSYCIKEECSKYNIHTSKQSNK